MKRNLYNALLAWKSNVRRKPLVLQGARQVGKTYLVNEFARQEYDDYCYLNFEEDPELATLFQGKLDPRTIVENISLYFSKPIMDSSKVLIFFDEVQVVPRALTSLKYFCEDAPEYHVIAAGSLLGVAVSREMSFPVGKVNFLNMYPMSFEEFLYALGENMLVDKLETCSPMHALSSIIHEKLLSYYRRYLYVGGMPEVVGEYVSTGNMEIVRKVQCEILEAYKRDFSKYTNALQAIKSSEFWHSIPHQLAKENKKFKYKDIKRNARRSTFEQTIEWLKAAGLINVCYCVSHPKLPLAGYADFSKFKVYLLDTGLLGAMLSVPSKIIVEDGAIFKQYNGAFVENFVAQELRVTDAGLLHYWKSKSDAEVDFLLEKNNAIFPVEVKSGTSLNLKSLRSYATKYSPKCICRVSPRNFALRDDFVNIPIYAVSALSKLLGNLP